MRVRCPTCGQYTFVGYDVHTRKPGLSPACLWAIALGALMIWWLIWLVTG